MKINIQKFMQKNVLFQKRPGLDKLLARGSHLEDDNFDQGPRKYLQHG